MFETKDTLNSKLRVFNHSSIDSLYQVQFTIAQINRVAIDAVDLYNDNDEAVRTNIKLKLPLSFAK